MWLRSYRLCFLAACQHFTLCSHLYVIMANKYCCCAGQDFVIEAKLAFLAPFAPCQVPLPLSAGTQVKSGNKFSRAPRQVIAAQELRKI